MSKNLSKKLLNAEKVLRNMKNNIYNDEEGISEMIDEPIGEVNYEDDDDYNAQSNTSEITFVEFAIINMYLHNCFKGKHDEVNVSSYGQVDGSGRLSFGGVFENSGSYWFNSKFKDDDNDFVFQTKMFVDNRNELQIQFHTSVKKAVAYSEFEKFQKKIMELAFNNSEYKGKCIKVKMKDLYFAK